MSTKRRKRHALEQIVRKLRDADAMLNPARSTWRRIGVRDGVVSTLSLDSPVSAL